MIILLAAAVVALAIQTAFMFIVVRKASRATDQVELLTKILAAVTKTENKEEEKKDEVIFDDWDAFNAQWEKEGKDKIFGAGSKEKQAAYEKFLVTNK